MFTGIAHAAGIVLFLVCALGFVAGRLHIKETRRRIDHTDWVCFGLLGTGCVIGLLLLMW